MRVTVQLSILEIIANSRQVVAEHLDGEYPIRVRLTRPLTDREREIASTREGWQLPREKNEIVLTGRLETFNQPEIDLLIQDLQRIQNQGRVLDDEDEQRRERERLEHIAQMDRVNELNRIIERRRYP